MEGVKKRAERYQEIVGDAHKAVAEETPFPMDAVWEAERLGYGRIIGYHAQHSIPEKRD